MRWINSKTMVFMIILCMPLAGVGSQRDYQFVVSGEPFFPLGWFGVRDKGSLRKISQEGFNTVLVSQTGTERLKDYLVEADRLGIKIIVDARTIEKDSQGRSVEVYDATALQNRVGALKDYPSLFAWFTSDEPENRWIPPERTDLLYRKIKQIDSLHPVIPCIAYRYRRYATSLDAIMANLYPVYDEEISFKTSALEAVARDVKRAMRAVREENKIGLIYLLQAFGDGAWERRYPTYEEERYMTYTAIIHGARGIMFWAHYRSRNERFRRDLRILLSELKPLIPVIMSGSLDSLADVDSQDIHLIFRSWKVEYYLFAVNDSRRILSSVEFTLPDSLSHSIAEVLSEDRTLPIRGQILKDGFEPYGVHIYKIR